MNRCSSSLPLPRHDSCTGGAKTPSHLTGSVSIFRIRSRCTGNVLLGVLPLEFSRREILRSTWPVLLAPPMCTSWHVPTTVSALQPRPMRTSLDCKPHPSLGHSQSITSSLKGEGRQVQFHQRNNYMPKLTATAKTNTNFRFLCIYARICEGQCCLQIFQIQVTSNLNRKMFCVY